MASQDRYREAGVDIEKGNKFVGNIAKMVRSTHTSAVLTEIGGFSGLMALPTGMKQPVLVSSTDGVGTKLKIAFMLDKHDTIGIDMVAMCVNDIVVTGAKPLFMLDYLATGKLELGVAEAVIAGVVEGCRQAKSALIGGETAEMPGMYPPGEYDLAGFAVGLVEREKIIDGSSIGVGAKVVALASDGLHSNGYSLVRKIVFEELGLKPGDYVDELGCTIGEELIRPTRIYVEPVTHLARDFHLLGAAHITGGGILENLPRVLPSSCRAVLWKGSWPEPPIFGYLAEKGGLTPKEMLRTFNSGLGMMMVVPGEEAEEIVDRLKGLNERAFVVGEILPRDKKQAAVEVVE